MANKLSGIFGFGLVVITLAWAPLLSDSMALAQYQPADMTSAQSIDAVSTGIANIQQQVGVIQQEITGSAISQEPQTLKLDQIQAQIDIIRSKKDEIAVQVEQIVIARQVAQPQVSAVDYTQISEAVGLIQQAAQLIAQEMQAGGEATSTLAIQTPSVESQISTIRQKIAQLKLEQQAMNASQAPTQAPETPSQATSAQPSPSAPTGVTCDAATGTCQATTSNNQTAATQPVQAAQPKGFWQSIWDFIRNLFTF